MGHLVWAAAALPVLALWAVVAWRRADVAVVVVVGLVVVSAHLLALAYSWGADASVVRALIPVKDVAASTLVVALVVRALRAGRFPALWWLAIGLLALAVVPALLVGVPDVPASDLALSARNVAVPFVAVLTGLLLTAGERRRVLVWGSLVIAAGAVYALVEYALPVSVVRDDIAVGRYWEDVKEQPFLLDPRGSGLPGNFFTGGRLRRLSGSFGDPLAAGYTLAVGLVMVALARSGRVAVGLSAVLATALVLTVTRAAVLIAVCTLLPEGVRLIRSRPRIQLVALGCAGLAAAAGAMLLPSFRTYVVDTLTGRDSSMLGHLEALRAVDDYNYSAWGTGLGAAGAAVGRGTENLLITLALQLGLVGLGLVLAAAALFLHAARRRWECAGISPSFWGLMVGVCISALLSEQILTFNAGWPLMLLAGIAPHRTVTGDDETRPIQAGAQSDG